MNGGGEAEVRYTHPAHSKTPTEAMHFFFEGNAKKTLFAVFDPPRKWQK